MDAAQRLQVVDYGEKYHETGMWMDRRYNAMFNRKRLQMVRQLSGVIIDARLSRLNWLSWCELGRGMN